MKEGRLETDGDNLEGRRERDGRQEVGSENQRSRWVSGAHPWQRGGSEVGGACAAATAREEAGKPFESLANRPMEMLRLDLWPWRATEGF